MKSLRRSLHKDAGGQPYNPPSLPTLSKPVSAVVPPKKVIRALAGHRPTAPQELSFAKGDFFYVIRDIVSANGNEYYEAHNPVTGSRGLVPKSLFEGFDKNNAPTQRIVTQAGPGARISTPVSVPRVSGPLSPKPNSVFYAVVLHDFQAERTDELDARAGDAISVVAHSNREWFVAKPIGKLGGPGLIPASFLEVRDPLTGQAIEDLDSLIDRGELPPVEEWKKATMNYKASSIALGVIDGPNAGPVPNSKFQQMALTSPGADARYPFGAPPPGGDYTPEPQGGPGLETFLPEPDLSRLDLASPLPRGVLVRAEVSSFHFEANDWHFRVNATFKPDPSATNPFDPNPPTSHELTLFRVYDDFYVFQIQLLAAFPLEAGRDPERPDEPPEEDDGGQSTRLLPFMPGPQDDVDETLADSRRHDLDVYLKELVALRDVGAEHILRCELVRKFFAAREGDIENEVHSVDQEDDYGTTKNATQSYYGDQGLNQRQSEYEDSYDSQSRTNPSYSTAPTSQYSKENAHPYARAQQHGRDSSGSGSGHQYERPLDRNRQDDGKYGQPHPYARGQDASSGYGGARGPGVTSPTTRYNNPSFGSPKMRNSSPQRAPYPNNQPTGSTRESEYRGHQTTPSTSTTVNVSTGGNPNSPRISSHNSNAAFVKIKIFHSSTDELIAIRVSPRVGLRQLMEKVRERLGNNVESVKYRDGMAAGSGGTGHFVDIMDDAELRDWMASGDKLVLYAE